MPSHSTRKGTQNTKKSLAAALWAFFAFVVLVAQGCRKEEPKAPELPAFDGQRAYAEVEALVQISPRDAGTPGGQKAAQHLYQRLNALGIAAEIDTFTDQTPAGEKTMHNVIGRIPGRTDQWIVLGSHFDTMPGIENFQGANDSGSSTGVLLELARILAKSTPDTGIIFAFFDGEEGIADYIPGDGLHGSRHFAGQLLASGKRKQVRAMILLDMVGDKDLHFVLPVNSSRSLARALLEAAHATGHREYFSLSRNLLITDDHIPFENIGIPALVLIDLKFGSEPGKKDYWHTAADHLQHISAESLALTGTVTRQLLRQLLFNPP